MVPRGALSLQCLRATRGLNSFGVYTIYLGMTHNITIFARPVLGLGDLGRMELQRVEEVTRARLSDGFRMWGRQA